ncbi:MAG: hypothetical protein ACE5KO_03285 [Candidatus Bathyarchaeia archaeon]
MVGILLVVCMIVGIVVGIGITSLVSTPSTEQQSYDWLPAEHVSYLQITKNWFAYAYEKIAIMSASEPEAEGFVKFREWTQRDTGLL